MASQGGLQGRLAAILTAENPPHLLRALPMAAAPEAATPNMALISTTYSAPQGKNPLQPGFLKAPGRPPGLEPGLGRVLGPTLEPGLGRVATPMPSCFSSSGRSFKSPILTTYPIMARFRLHAQTPYRLLHLLLHTMNGPAMVE